MAVVRSVTIGSKHIDLEAFTGEVVESHLTEYTRQHYENRPQGGYNVRYTTSYWNKFRVRGAGGKEWSLEVLQSVATVKVGQQVTLFWGVVKKKESDWLAVYNHDKSQLGFVTGTKVKLAGPPLAPAILFVCGFIQFFTLFGMVNGYPSAFLTFLVLCAPYVWVYRRRKALMTAVEDSIPRLGHAPPASADTPAPSPKRPAEIRI